MDEENYRQTEQLISGGISRAITDPMSKEALAYADRYFENV